MEHRKSLILNEKKHENNASFFAVIMYNEAMKKTECLINPEVKAILEAMCERVDQWEKDQNERFKREREQQAKEDAIRWHKEIKEKAKNILQSSH